MPEIYLPCTLHRISEHIWWFTPDDHTDRPSLCAVVGSERVLLLDIGASIAHTQAFLNALAAQGIGAPDFAVLTHWHWDHVFGSDALTCPIIAHVETATNIERMMTLDYSDANLLNLVAEGHEVDFTREHMVLELSNQQRKNLTLRQPDVTFCSAITLHLGGVTCQIEHVGGDHASDAVVIYVQEDKLLFLGDCFYYTVYQEPQHYTKPKLLDLIDTLEQFNADTFIMGHAGIIITQSDIEKEFALIRACYHLLHQYGVEKSEVIAEELKRHYEPDYVDDYLRTILAGLAIS